MVQVTFIEASGRRRSITAKPGEPLMYAAKDAGIDGIIAECGGSAMCATFRPRMDRSIPSRISP